MEKPTLAEAIKQRYIELGTNSHRLFHELGVASDEMINSWLRKNRFKASWLPTFMRLLDMPEDIEELQKEFDFEMYGGFSGLSMESNEKKNLLLLIRVVAKSDIEQVSFGDLRFLLEIQAKLGRPVTIALVQELIQLRHTKD